MWNHVVWEIAPLNRDRITALDFAHSLPKKFPDPGDQTILDIDQLEFGVVIPDGTLSERSESHRERNPPVFIGHNPGPLYSLSAYGAESPAGHVLGVAH